MRFLTAGESHGPILTVIVEGMPAGLGIVAEEINQELFRRQKGYGRGGRMMIESDTVEIVSGVRYGKTLGSPITLMIENKDFRHWQEVMAVEGKETGVKVVTKPRPGHADLNGGMKYNHRDLRNVLERSSARETAARVAVGAVAKKLLKELGIEIASHVPTIGKVTVENISFSSLKEVQEMTEASQVRCLDKKVEGKMMAEIDCAKLAGDSVGGIVEVVVTGVPVGLGSYVHHDRKLDAKIAGAMMSINAFKGVEFGIGFLAASKLGSQIHDEIIWQEETGFSRKTNRAGGFEGGMTTGMPIVVRGVMKPIPTLYKPLASVDIETKEVYRASIERSDSCAVPAAAVVAEAVVAWEIAKALVEQFESDNFAVMKKNLKSYKQRMREF